VIGTCYQLVQLLQTVIVTQKLTVKITVITVIVLLGKILHSARPQGGNDTVTVIVIFQYILFSI